MTSYQTWKKITLLGFYWIYLRAAERTSASCHYRHSLDHDYGFHAEAVTRRAVLHGNAYIHAHYFYKKDLTAEQIQTWSGSWPSSNQKPSAAVNDAERYSRDASDEEKIAYIRQTYGVPKEAVAPNGFYLNNPDQAYDPNHTHPYAVRK